MLLVFFLCGLDADLLLALDEDDELLASLTLDADLVSDESLDAELLAFLSLHTELLASMALDADPLSLVLGADLLLPLDAKLLVSLALNVVLSSPCVALELADADLVIRFSRYRSKVGALRCRFLPD